MVTALVTGAAAGLGAALAERLLADGTEVVAVDRAPMRARSGLHRHTLDLADAAAVETFCVELVGSLDLVVLNAGVSATGRFETLPAAAYERLLRVNVTAPLLMAARLVERMEPGGTIVFVSSLSHRTGYPGASVYAASKDAVAAYARSVRRPFARRDVRVMCVFPGPVRTEHARRHAPPDADEAARMDPDELARRILQAVRRGRRTLYPGAAARATAIAGRAAPGRMTRLMRRLIFERLQRDVW